MESVLVGRQRAKHSRLRCLEADDGGLGPELAILRASEPDHARLSDSATIAPRGAGAPEPRQLGQPDSVAVPEPDPDQGGHGRQDRDRAARVSRIALRLLEWDSSKRARNLGPNAVQEAGLLGRRAGSQQCIWRQCPRQLSDNSSSKLHGATAPANGREQTAAASHGDNIVGHELAQPGGVWPPQGLTAFPTHLTSLTDLTLTHTHHEPAISHDTWPPIPHRVCLDGATIFSRILHLFSSIVQGFSCEIIIRKGTQTQGGDERKSRITFLLFCSPVSTHYTRSGSWRHM